MDGFFVPKGNVYERLNDERDVFLETKRINHFFRQCLFKGIRNLDDIENVMKTTDSPMYKFYEMAMLREDVRMKRLRTEMFSGIVFRKEGGYIV